MTGEQRARLEALRTGLAGCVLRGVSLFCERPRIAACHLALCLGYGLPPRPCAVSGACGGAAPARLEHMSRYWWTLRRCRNAPRRFFRASVCWGITDSSLSRPTAVTYFWARSRRTRRVWTCLLCRRGRLRAARTAARAMPPVLPARWGRTAFKRSAAFPIFRKKKGDLSEEERALLRENGCLWGCDACQEACPYNRAPRETEIPEFRKALIQSIPREMLEGLSNLRSSGCTGHGRSPGAARACCVATWTF